ncbi:MAG: hypothetical protein MUF31_11185 [Akkermansiaceae bacterium]|jgi:hypothetical protein|nr:hypothetical protein [Akkermansiaceae bacterium]
MDIEESSDFNQRLSEWISSQGFWFQLRHSLSGGGGLSTALFHLLRLGMRLGIVLLIVGAGAAFWVSKQIDTQGFQDGLKEKLVDGLNAGEMEISGLARVQGKATVFRVGGTGTSDSVFDNMEIRNLRMNMGWLDGLTGVWEAGVAEANTVDIDLKAGFNSEESARAAGETLFGSPVNMDLRGLKADNTRLSWGYFERAYGGIEGSDMNMTRTGDGWRCSFKGGTFTQNWIRGFEIVELLVVLDASGVTVEKGKLRSGGGTIEFRNVKVTGAVTPKPSGSLVFSRVPVQSLIPSNAAEMVSGTISGEFELGGSTNNTEGVTFKGRVDLDGVDRIILRSGFRVFESLDVVDVFNSYKKLEFDSGGFDIASGNGQVLISGLDLKAGELVTVQGRVIVRKPDEEELVREFGDLTGEAPGVTESSAAAEERKRLEMSLRQAAEIERKEKEQAEQSPTAQQGDENVKFFDSLGEQRRLRRDAMDRARNLFLFNGGVRITVRSEAFDRSRALRERFPVDQATGRVALDVPLVGHLGQLGMAQAEEILRLGEVK